MLSLLLYHVGNATYIFIFLHLPEQKIGSDVLCSNLENLAHAIYAKKSRESTVDQNCVLS